MRSGQRDDSATASGSAGQQLTLDEAAGGRMSGFEAKNNEEKDTDSHLDERSCSDSEDADDWSTSSDGGGEAGSSSADLPLLTAPSWVPDHTFKVMRS